MDEIAFQFGWMYYAALSRGAEGLRRLGGLYAADSVRVGGAWWVIACMCVCLGVSGHQLPV
jgi:hypothetical protein